MEVKRPRQVCLDSDTGSQSCRPVRFWQRSGRLSNPFPMSSFRTASPDLSSVPISETIEHGDRRLRRNFLHRFAMLVSLCTALTGCTLVPGSGPSLSTISSAAEGRRPGLASFMLADINERVISLLSRTAAPTLNEQFGDRHPPSQNLIGPGDLVTVTIWEGAQGGLFSPAADVMGGGTKAAAIPEQQVAQDGAIMVPFAGRIKVAGKTPNSVQRDIESRLTGKTVEPQVLVVVNRNISYAATVIGEVNSPSRVPLSPAGDRVLDVMALAGGNKSPNFETSVTVTRRNVSVSVPLMTIMAKPQENIYVQPGDTVSFTRDTQTFTVFGASNQNALVPFGSASVSLEEAIAKAGGLLDSRADPQGVYVMRVEPESVARTIQPSYVKPARDGKVFVIYQLNMGNPDAILLAREFPVRNKDAIYIANAPLSNMQKVLSIFTTVAQPVGQGVGIAAKVY